MTDLHKRAGLVPAGKDEGGEQMWLGTKKQWEKYETLQALSDEGLPLPDGEDRGYIPPHGPECECDKCLDEAEANSDEERGN